jgi:hypothetical protein
MKYETMGGAVKDTNDQFIRLAELKPGDRFRSRTGEQIYQVIDERCKFNARAGAATRGCLNTRTNMPEAKLCRIEVIKL